MQVYIVGIGNSPVGKLKKSVIDLLKDALHQSCQDTQISLNDISALYTCPPAVQGGFMFAHTTATLLGLLPSNREFYAKCIDTGGSGPISAIIEAANLLEKDSSPRLACIAVADAVGSIPTAQLLKLVIPNSDENDDHSSKPVPMLYDHVAQWHNQTYKTSREQFAMTSSLFSQHAKCTKQAITKKFYSVEQILKSPQVAEFTSMRECARRADGAAVILIANQAFLQKSSWLKDRAVEIVGKGENSNVIDFRVDPPVITENLFCLASAFKNAMIEAERRLGRKLSVKDFECFGIYDCFPIAFMKSIEDLGVTEKGKSGPWIEEKYKQLMKLKAIEAEIGPQEVERRFVEIFPFNTHGGLMHFAAPWECPAAYNVIECVRQLRSECDNESKQIKFKSQDRLAIVTGNGGVFSSAAVLVLSKKFEKLSKL